jgi:hypothetical protein
MLCKGHNSKLSPLDSEGARFFAALAKPGAPQRAALHSETAVQGELIERWFLKCLIGVAAAGFGRMTSGEPIAWSPGDEWLRLLFGLTAWRPGLGLYCIPQFEFFDGSPHVSLAPMTAARTTELAGGLFTICGHRFALAVGGLPAGGDLRTTFRGAVYRPTAFNFERTTRLTLSWRTRALPAALAYALEQHSSTTTSLPA